MKTAPKLSFAVALAALVFESASCAHDGRSRQIRAFRPYAVGWRPAADADLHGTIREWVGRTVYVSPEGTGIDTLRACYELRIPYMRNASRVALDPYRIESIRRDDRFSHLMVARLVGPRGEVEKLWFDNEPVAFFGELGADYLLEDPVAANPDWPPSTWDAIREQRPAPGMTPDMVRLALGEPASVDTAADGRTRWVYPWFGAVLTFGAASTLEAADVEDPWL